LQQKIDMRLARWIKKAPQYYGETYIDSMVVFNGKLYGGTFESGLLFEWNGSDAWILRASPLGTPPNIEHDICSLAIFNNKLYGGTSPHGKLVEWNGTDAWIEKAPQSGGETHIYSLAVFNGKLYAGSSPHGKLFEWNGSNAWIEKAPQLGSETAVNALTVFNEKLYGGTYPHGKLYEWNGSNAWVEKAPQLGSETDIYSLAIFNDKLYGGGYGTGKLFEWNGIDAWIEKAPQLGSNTIRSLVVFNGKLYAGTYWYNYNNGGGKLFEWNGTDAWVEKARQLYDQMEISCLVVLNEKLYGGAAPDGLLFQLTWAADKPARLQSDVKIYVIPPNIAFDRSKLDQYSIRALNCNLKRYRQDDSLKPRELELTVDRRAPIAQFHEVLVVDEVPVFRGYVERELSVTREKRRYLCKGHEAKLYHRFMPKMAFTRSSSTLHEVLRDSFVPDSYYPGNPGILFCANSYWPPGTEYTIYDAEKNIALLRFKDTHIDIGDANLFVRNAEGNTLKLLTRYGALSDLQSSDLSYYVDPNKDLYIRVMGSRWYALGGLWAENVFDTKVRLGEQDIWWNRLLNGALYTDHDEIASLLFNLAKSHNYFISIRDDYEYTHLDLKLTSGRGAGTGLITLHESDLLSFEKTTASKPPAQAIIGRGEGNQIYSAVDMRVKSGLFDLQSFDKTYRRRGGKLIALTDSLRSSREQVSNWTVRCKPQKVVSLVPGDFVKLLIEGEPVEIPQSAQIETSPASATLQLGERVPGFVDAWQSRSVSKQVFKDYVLWEAWPKITQSVTFKPRDQAHNACAVGSMTFTLPAGATSGQCSLVTLDLSCSLSDAFAAVWNAWYIAISISGNSGHFGVFEEIPLEDSLHIDITDILTFGATNTVQIVAKYLGNFTNYHSSCSEHPDITCSGTMKFWRIN
jgi:hypothetical protein